MKNRLFYKITSLIAATSLFITLAAPAFAQEPQNDSVTISSAEEFIDFAKSCSLDKWSHGKTVTLTADISLSGMDFTPVPIFGGTFDGGGHTVSGVRIDETGSHQGLFRYLEKSAVVRDLNVIGVIVPSGSRSEVGGIVGENAGTIRNCTFRGTVRGESAVGGIAGANSETGSIIECSASGTVIGKSAAGGIAGRSEGTLLKCTNSAGINLTIPDNSENMIEFDPESYISPDGSEPDLLNSHTDVGGIVGYTGGIVQSCDNTGNVGYPHVGYNIGGIAGRQSGYLAGCTNSGTINGRKDVGGIVGQAEPYLTIDPGKETLEELRAELHTLNDLIDKALNDVQGTGDDVSERLTAMKKYTDTAENSCKEMLDEVTGFVDENVDTVNTMVADITNALDKIAPAIDEIAAAGGSLSDMSDDLGAAFESLKDVADIGDAAMRDIRAALDDLKNASDSLSDAAEYFRTAIDAMTDGVVSSDKEQQSSAAKDIENAADSLSSALEDVAEAADALGGALANAGLIDEVTVGGITREGGSGDENNAPETPEDNDDFDIGDISDILKTIEDNWNKAKTPLKNASEAMLDAAESLSSAFSKLQNAAEKLDGVSNGFNKALDRFEGAADAASAIGKTLQRSFTDIGDAVRVLTEDGPESFRRLGDDFRSAGNRLHGSVTAMTDDMEALNRQLNANSGVVADDLRAINAQLEVVSDMVIDAVSELLDTASTPTIGDGFLDTSDEDIAATRQGKVTDCVNSGTVSGDHNIGGIVGAMAVEFDLDPESDLSENVRFGATYETKAVLQNSKNFGMITAKKDCAGGIAGRMDLGTVISCGGYGEISSSGGSYVGGIAGYSDAVVRNCYAKSVLSGGSYIGGITGRANDLRNNFAIVTVKDGGEYVGAVAGSIAKDGTLRENRFVDTGTAGIDGISYEGRAEPIEFSELEKLGGVPKEFTEFGITLTADGKVIGKIPFRYGDDLSNIELPEVPVFEGCFGRWNEFDKSGVMSDITLEAVYAPWITIVASEETQDKLALALAEGRFTDETVLHAEDSTVEPPVRGDARVLNITLTGADAEMGTVPIRLLNTGGKNAAVWRLDNGSWTRVDSTVSGKYLLLEMNGMSGTFCIQPMEIAWLPILLIAGLSVILIIVIVILVAVRKKKHGKSKVANK
ncbi:MAG: hypothetical protein HDT42_06345 [Ruminococcaceae bacterium]|nr:hypothetical protein [Oscillospiraceae bacterium]